MRTTKQVSQELNDYYNKTNMQRCPFCEDNLIVVENIDHDGDFVIWKEVRCPTCGKEWKEVFQYSNVEFYEEDLEELV